MSKGWTYAKAGVDIKQIRAIHESIAASLGVRGRGRRRVSGIGGYAGLVEVGRGRLLAMHIDGVGTKALLASRPEEYEVLGIDAVAMNVNDLICVGARPLALVDYITLPRPDREIVEAIVRGVVRGAGESGARLVGGETAILPGILGEGEIDVAASAVGIVRRRDRLPRPGIRPGDALIGIESNGLHCNGFSLVRKVLLGEGRHGLDELFAATGRALRQELLRPTRIYVKLMTRLIQKTSVKGLAHITGGAFTKLTRLGDVAYVLDSLPEPPPIFNLIMDEGRVELAEMYRTFNMGVGMVCVVPAGEADYALRTIRRGGARAWLIGRIEQGRGVFIGGERIWPLS